MPAADTLSQRIKAEFDAHAQRRKTEAADRTKGAQDREKRLAQFASTCDDLKAVWRPRLEEFAKQFGDKIKVTPRIDPEQREATILFITDLASITLRLIVSAGSDVTKLVLDYDLLVTPMYFDYERHSRLEVPLDKVDRDAVARWIEDRLLSCVKTYLAIQDNVFYAQRAMIEDPITKAKFLRDNAVAKLEHDGRTVYFASEDSLQQYKQKHQLT